MSDFYWDQDAWEVRNADRSLWLRRQARFFHQLHDHFHSESYAIFEPDFSIAFSATEHSPWDRDTDGSVEFTRWTRDSQGRAIALIDSASRFHFTTPPPSHLFKSHGPLLPQNNKFDSVERQDRYIALLPKMLAVLPELSNHADRHADLANGRIGYAVEFSKGFHEKRARGVFLEKGLNSP